MWPTFRLEIKLYKIFRLEIELKNCRRRCTNQWFVLWQLEDQMKVSILGFGGQRVHEK